MSVLELLIILILVFWLVGAFAYPMGGSLIHVLLVIVIVLVILRLLRR